MIFTSIYRWRTGQPVRFLKAGLLWLVACIAVFFSGCASFEQQSDWRWQQANPDYRRVGAQEPNPRD
jgi:hypothetical protein